ncbi:MAG: hypothetical protein J6D15_03870 [Clostridia bacterium]|nr:hypothetical protein [Clostridia bacterium]
MKRYERPEIELVSFDVEDIITTSADIFADPKTVVEAAGYSYEAKDFGTQPFSIFTQPGE